MEPYKILYKGGMGEIVEKKSRFIATARPVGTEEEAAAFVEEMKKKYWDASHNCYAYVIGEDSRIQRCSDDGEPSQTAGRPMLDVLLGAEIHNVCVVVTRYFGGTLLGTGGLVRAYSKAVQEGLINSQVLEKQPARKLLVGTNYNDFGKIQYLVAQMGVTTLDTIYTDQVEIILLVPEPMFETLISKITEGTGGRAVIEKRERLYFGMLQKELVLFQDAEQNSDGEAAKN